mgnify:CR=1 FL=1
MQGRSPTEAWGTTNGNLSMMKGMNGDEKALDNVSTLILDEYRRMMIIKKARERENGVCIVNTENGLLKNVQSACVWCKVNMCV